MAAGEPTMLDVFTVQAKALPIASSILSMSGMSATLLKTEY